jgi:hypothetical protein
MHEKNVKTDKIKNSVVRKAAFCLIRVCSFVLRKLVTSTG